MPRGIDKCIWLRLRANVLRIDKCSWLCLRANVQEAAWLSSFKRIWLDGQRRFCWLGVWRQPFFCIKDWLSNTWYQWHGLMPIANEAERAEG